ncbi:hypothetical protein Tco_0048731, partial [Tanacetum coccineum]
TQTHRKTTKDTKLPQTSVPQNLEADKAVHKEGGDSVERAITTAASLDAAQDRNGYRWKSQAPRHHGGTPAQTRCLTWKKRKRKYRQVESSDDDLNEEDASKQGRRNEKIKKRQDKEMTRQSQLEKKYPLIKELLEKMLNLQLEAEEESTMAFELIKFIKSMLEEY